MPRRPNVLVVDDDLLGRKLMEARLGPAGFVVRTAENGQEALDLLDGGYRPAVIVLDFIMPVLDGPAFHRALLERPGVRDIPVIGLTAGDDTADFETIAKPANMERLVARLHTLAAERARAARPRRRRLKWVAAILLAAAVKALLEYLKKDRR